MKRELIIGWGAIAAAGLIAGGIYFSQNNPFNIEPTQEDVEANRQKIEELYFEELKNTERYVFASVKKLSKAIILIPSWEMRRERLIMCRKKSI